MQFVDGVKRHPGGGQIIDLRQLSAPTEVISDTNEARITNHESRIMDLQLEVANPSRRQWQWLVGVPAMILMVAVVRFGINAKQATTVTRAVASTVAASPKPMQIVPATANLDTELQKTLGDFAAAQPVPVAIIAKDLKTGKYAVHNTDQVFVSASLYKLFVANQILHRVDYEGLSLSAPAGGGTNRSIESCIAVMINVSDNACGKALGTMLGWHKQNQSLAAQGFGNTDLTVPYTKTSAGDVAKLLEQLYTSEFLKPFSNNMLVQQLKNQRVNNRLPTGLPAGTDIAHKTGDLEGNMHDAGIVYGPNTDYLVVMLSGPWQTPASAPAAFKDLSAKLYTYFNH